MREILADVETWRNRGERIGIATVVETWGSSPRPVGSKLAVNLNGGMSGSVSAGCVENAVIEATLASIRSGEPRLLTFAVSKETALDVGLTCGGTIKVFVEPLEAYASVFDPLKAHLDAHKPVGIACALDGPAAWRNRKLAVFADGSMGGNLQAPDLPARLRQEVAKRLESEGGIVELEGFSFFIDIHPRVPRLIIVGAVHIAECLAAMAVLAGFDITIVDPRRAFAVPERFPRATLILQWPAEALASLSLDRDSYVVTLSHDPKLDDPALRHALASAARYIGALGSKRSNLLRLERLREAGLTSQQLARLHAPTGLPIGSRSAADIAVSVLAELIQVRNIPVQPSLQP